MSTTPRTDEVDNMPHPDAQWHVDELRSIARQLERELTASNAALEAAKAERDKFEQWAKESKENAAYAVMLRNQELEACQKELAEAKDDIAENNKINDVLHKLMVSAEKRGDDKAREDMKSTLTELLEVAERLEKANAPKVIAMLIEVARATHDMAEGCCEDHVTCPEMVINTYDPDYFNRLSESLDALDELPEPGELVYGTGPAKAEVQLKPAIEALTDLARINNRRNGSEHDAIL